MVDDTISDQLQLRRELVHWSQAIARMRNLEIRASTSAWRSLGQYLGISLRNRLLEAVDRLEQSSIDLIQRFDQVETRSQLQQVRANLLRLRRQYLRTETTLDFFTDALNTRSNAHMAKLLSACDHLAWYSMNEVLSSLSQKTPQVLTYIDKGLGASILKQGLRLWDGGTINPVAVIKVVFHNLMRPTSIIHEAGHQVAHILGWNEDLRSALGNGLSSRSKALAQVWSNWASEIAADAFAFVHAGYASVASLHDVLSGGNRFVFRFLPDDPHPVSYIRVVLGTSMCRFMFGTGPWDALEKAWIQRYEITNAASDIRQILSTSLPIMPHIVKIILQQPMAAFGRRSLVEMVDPMQVQPAALLTWEQKVGSSLYQSPYRIGKNPVRLLALTGYHIATKPLHARHMMRLYENWMLGPALASNT